MAKHNPIIRAKKKKAQALIDENRFAEARELYRQICGLDRLDADAWFTLGLLNGQLEYREETVSCFREAAALRPDYAEAHFNLGKALADLGRLDEAAQSYRRALACRPQWPEALNNLGNIEQALGGLDVAAECFEQALRTRPDFAEAYANLGNVLQLQGRVNQAVEIYRRALAIRPHYPKVYKALGIALANLGRLADAMACYREAARQAPNDIGLIAAEALLLERQGLSEQAYALIKPFIDNGTDNFEIAQAFAALCGGVGRCDEAIAMLERHLARSDMPRDRQRLIAAHFALGRLYDRRGDYDRAFAHYREGNDLKPYSFDKKAYAEFISALITVFDADFMRRAPRATHGSERPIFIVGMPRSGTSLVEQILASHPQVFGAGELEDIKYIAADACGAIGSMSSYPACVRQLTEEACDRLGARYLERLAQLSPDARYVTDKMPTNFLHLGLIALLFPRARIIHCLRDPLDTCLSCYFHDFSGFHPHTYRLDALGSYYGNYRRLMRHWQAVLPIPMLTVSYEALVQDQRDVTQSMLNFCGLEWDERCMRFYETRRTVNTLSYDQVRKPIYAGSIGQWRRYETYLEPLKKALAES
jgi:tetratricopeptide (TPR) repeat protein